MTCCDGEDGVSDKWIGFGKRHDLLASGKVEYFGPMRMEVLYKTDGRSSVGVRDGKRDQSNSTQK